MSNDLVKRLRLQSEISLMRLPLDHVYVSHNEAADRIEELEKQLSLINNTLNVTLKETMTANWKEFCEALIDETRELLGEEK